MRAVIIVFEDMKYLDSITDEKICIGDVKAVCDWEDRWEVFESYLKPEHQKQDLYRDEDGIVRWEYSGDASAYGVIKKVL